MKFSFNRPSKNVKFQFPIKVAGTAILALLANSLLFALIYYAFDNHFEDKESRIRGIKDKKNFWNYLYFAIVIGSTLGLGDMIPIPGDENRQTSSEMRIVIACQVFASLFIAKFIDATENFILSSE
jgi:uncharacterized membrane protein